MIYLGADHAGYEMKEALKRGLLAQGLEVQDLGAHSLDSADDYPDFIVPAARAVAENPEENRGVVIGGSGQGEAMAANKVRGVRAAVYYGGSPELVELARRHNNANVLSLGARFLDEDEVLRAVQTFLDTPFEGGRHERRVQKLNEF